MLVPGQVKQAVDQGHGVETGIGQINLAHVCLDAGHLRDRLCREPQHGRGDVDSRDAPAACDEQTGHGFAGTAPQVQDMTATGGQAPVEGVEHLGHVVGPATCLISGCQLVVDLLQGLVWGHAASLTAGRRDPSAGRMPRLLDCGAAAQPLGKRREIQFADGYPVQVTNQSDGTVKSGALALFSYLNQIGSVPGNSMPQNVRVSAHVAVAL